jgi:hypothetical protein
VIDSKNPFDIDQSEGIQKIGIGRRRAVWEGEFEI